ncbi:MAG: hypothetical protein EBQ89_10905 [Alphaproteobacteria bacterium]|jgi:hypothetical protein|nr:hypothetical protein [Alphaproteobacteria bacterium]
MSVAIEVGAMAALIAATKKIKGSVFFVFSIVTLIQMIGNIFYCYQNINIEDELFKNWVELISPLLEMFGTDSTDFLSQKRWLSFLEGGLLPVISLASLHFFMKYDENTEEVIKEIIVEKEKPIEVIKEVPVEVIKEVIKEVPVEVIKEVPVSINNDVDIYDVDHDKDPKKINYTK